jgi:hypothetical protein
VNETYNILINFVAVDRQLAIAQPLAVIEKQENFSSKES